MNEQKSLLDSIIEMLKEASEKQLKLIYWAVFEITKKR